jgi:hypothetical protein
VRRVKVLGDLLPALTAEAQAVAGELALPARDQTAVLLLTFVVRGSRDLSQARHMESAAQGYRCFWTSLANH